MIRACVASLMALLGGCTGTAIGGSAGEPVPVLRHTVHAQCPLQVAHPSVSWLRTPQDWAEMQSRALTVPAPYDASATDFGRESVVVVALARTATPSTQLQLPAAGAARQDAASATLQLTLQVTQALADTQPRALALGTPCMVIWLPALPALQRVVAQDHEGKLIAQP